MESEFGHCSICRLGLLDLFDDKVQLNTPGLCSHFRSLTSPISFRVLETASYGLVLFRGWLDKRSFVCNSSVPLAETI